MDRPFITVISGANRGIGQAIVQVCAYKQQEQPMVIYAASRGGNNLDLKHSPNIRIRYPKLDITDTQSIQDLVAEITQEHGGVDVLINNAGLNVTRPASGVRAYEDQKKIMDVNFRGTLQICRSFIPIMKAQGRIVNLSSLASSLQPYSESNQARFRNPTLSMSNLQQMAAEFEVRRPSGHIRNER
jgi:carbonyl reductase 1